MIKKSLARWQLIVYDLIIFAFTDLLLLVFYQGQERLPLNSILIHTVIGCVCIFAIRIAGGIYFQIWLVGVLITFMFFFSSHPTVGSNWLVLLFNPLPLVFWWYTVRKERAGCSCVYHTVARLWLFLFLCATYVIPQYINPEVKVLALCLLIRSMSHHAIFAYQLRKQ